MLNDFTGADQVYIACGYTDLRTVKSFITQPTQRVISKNFAMGVVKTAIIAPINAAISSNVIKKFSEVSAVNLTDAKKASVTNSNATNNNYFMKVPKC